MYVSGWVSISRYIGIKRCICICLYVRNYVYVYTSVCTLRLEYVSFSVQIFVILVKEKNVYMCVQGCMYTYVCKRVYALLGIVGERAGEATFGFV